MKAYECLLPPVVDDMIDEQNSKLKNILYDNLHKLWTDPKVHYAPITFSMKVLKATYLTLIKAIFKYLDSWLTKYLY
jgi:hypothetical protein